MTWYQILNTVYIMDIMLFFVYQWLRIESLGGNPGITWKSILTVSLLWPGIVVWFLLIPFSKKIREDFNRLKMERRVYKLRSEELKREEAEFEKKKEKGKQTPEEL